MQLIFKLNGIVHKYTIMTLVHRITIHLTHNYKLLKRIIKKINNRCCNSNNSSSSRISSIIKYTWDSRIRHSLVSMWVHWLEGIIIVGWKDRVIIPDIVLKKGLLVNCYLKLEKLNI